MIFNSIRKYFVSSRNCFARLFSSAFYKRANHSDIWFRHVLVSNQINTKEKTVKATFVKDYLESVSCRMPYWKMEMSGRLLFKCSDNIDHFKSDIQSRADEALVRMGNLPNKQFYGIATLEVNDVRSLHGLYDVYISPIKTDSAHSNLVRREAFDLSDKSENAILIRNREYRFLAKKFSFYNARQLNELFHIRKT